MPERRKIGAKRVPIRIMAGNLKFQCTHELNPPLWIQFCWQKNSLIWQPSKKIFFILSCGCCFHREQKKTISCGVEYIYTNQNHVSFRQMILFIVVSVQFDLTNIFFLLVRQKHSKTWQLDNFIKQNYLYNHTRKAFTRTIVFCMETLTFTNTFKFVFNIYSTRYSSLSEIEFNFMKFMQVYCEVGWTLHCVEWTLKI